MRLEKLAGLAEVSEFECGDEDLNDFIRCDAYYYQKNLLAESYLLKSEDVIIAYFTLLNDKIDIESFDDKTSYNRFRKRLFVNSKRLNAYPAIKVGRLAVAKSYVMRGYGSCLLDFIKLLIMDNRYSGCRFLTVDAYDHAVPFYEKNGFMKINACKTKANTSLMCYDLITAMI